MTKAEQTYATVHQECCTLLDRITETLGNMDAPSHRTTRGQVGDLERTRAALRELAESLGVEL